MSRAANLPTKATGEMPPSGPIAAEPSTFATGKKMKIAMVAITNVMENTTKISPRIKPRPARPAARR